ncbi:MULTISPECIES: amino acid ABC transporter permease [unclassified Achromobacter]|uniref:amino acid ABC transporter permease n=1 Tax=unclassified Achromobacter TaxID=2626865 RepID=UPI000B51E336|nr:MULTISPECIES: amino acid ABC transporter permease [unclassified Achromobacter]OWT73651.1 amino acid ABC transporter permease [Achromobacter sp. HZ34]OWT79433.1 amino acid ABC transporter permease [Achromobacter sp. HZ28]
MHISDWPYWGMFASGLLLTLKVSIMAYVGALVLGTLGVILRTSRIVPLRWAGTVYVEVIRNIPSLALVFIVVFGLPQIGLTLPLVTSVVVVLAIYEGAFACEVLRAGINCVDIGSAEAARALGLTNRETLFHIVLPQAVRSVVQPLTNVFIKTVINSSMIAIVGLADLTGVAQRVNIREAEPMLFFGVGLAYVTIALLGGLMGGFIDRKVRFTR